MADDEHFLSRLERLEAPQVADALALYYDAPLVRRVLAHVTERGHGDRVAISLDDPTEGPFVVVTQTGDFVTTLGRGMGVRDLPVVSRARWESIRRHDSLIKEAWARAEAMSHAELSSVSREIWHRGPAVSREAISTVLALGKLMEPRVVRAWISAHVDLGDALRQVRTRERWRALDDTFFHEAGRLMWRLGHLSVLVASSDFKKHAAERYPEVLNLNPAVYLVRVGLFGPALRAVWLLGKSGGVFFDALKEAFKHPPDRSYALSSALGLAAIARRFRKYRGEVRKLLDVPEKPNPTYEDSLRAYAGLSAGFGLRDKFPEEGARGSVVDVGRRCLFRVFGSLPADHPLHFAAEADIPAAMAAPMVAALDLNLWQCDEDVSSVALMLWVPTLLGMGAEELYVPRAVQDVLPRHDFAHSVRPALEELRRVRSGPGRSRRAELVPGRNEPCTCGSGRKYKRCCGA